VKLLFKFEQNYTIVCETLKDLVQILVLRRRYYFL